MASPLTRARRQIRPGLARRRQLRLLRYAGPHRRGLGLMFGAMLFDVLVNVARPWPLKVLIDNVIGAHPIPSWLEVLPGTGSRQGLLIWVVASEVVLFVAGTVTAMISNFLSLTLGQRMTWSLAQDLFRHLQSLSLSFHTRRAVGDLIERVTTDCYSIDTLLTGAVLPMLQALLTLVSVFVIMWALEWRLTLLAIAVVPFIAISIRFFGPPMRKRAREQRDAEGQMSAIVEQTLNAIPVVQAFNGQLRQELRFHAQAQQTIRAYVRASFAGMWFQLFTGFTIALGTAAVIYVGGSEALNGALTAGTVVVFVSYLGSLYDPIDALSQTAQTIQSASAETDRVSEVLEIAPDVSDLPDSRSLTLTGPVCYEHVEFGYEPGRPVLTDVTFTVPPGDVLAIVGPTGAGKSTLISLLVRFFDPWHGRVTIGGHDIRDATLRSLRSQIALVLQDPFIFPTTIAENIALGSPSATREQIVAAAQTANAHDFITRLPEGYETVAGERGATLSGGEKQRISIARAVLKDAPVLVLDEPTSALDARTETLLLAALERLMRGRVTLVVAHRLSTIRNASQIVVLADGRVAEAGTHEQLMATEGAYWQLYRQQLQLAAHGAGSRPVVGSRG